jgi:hypothetical protein
VKAALEIKKYEQSSMRCNINMGIVSSWLRIWPQILLMVRWL